MSTDPFSPPSRIQLRYASVLRYLSRAGIVILVIGFTLYLADIYPPLVPKEELPTLLQLRASEFVERTGSPTNWDWLHHLRTGEVVGNIGIVLLSIVTLGCFITILPSFIAARDYAFAAIAALQIIVFVLAALGLVAIGH